MARYERDPRLRRRLAILLAAGEAVAVTVVFYVIFCAYSRWLVLRFLQSLAPAYGAITLVAGLMFLVVAVVEAVLYVKGRPWVRMAFIVENGVLILGGLVWFVKVQIASTSGDSLAPLAGLVLPLVTLFPLLWPLLSFRPVPPTDA